jgi:hypothetical protein
MESLGYGVTVLLGASALWAMSGTLRERPLVALPGPSSVMVVEQRAATHPGDPLATRDLAQAYLDAHQPGLAVVWIEAAPPTVRNDVRVRHVAARALVDQGRNDEALALEREVVAACSATASDTWSSTGCDSVLVASAIRRASILQALVSLGVEDAQAQPEASLIAYRNATREARVWVE